MIYWSQGKESILRKKEGFLILTVTTKSTHHSQIRLMLKKKKPHFFKRKHEQQIFPTLVIPGKSTSVRLTTLGEKTLRWIGSGLTP